MERKDYRPRLIDNIIDSYLKAFGAVCVEGPKWCGKTWTSSYHCQSEIMLGNPDGNFQNRQLALALLNLMGGGFRKFYYLAIML